MPSHRCPGQAVPTRPPAGDGCTLLGHTGSTVTRYITESDVLGEDPQQT